MPTSVAASMPPRMPVPTECWVAAPAPEALTSGSTPRMKASEVITMGRSRARPASTAASTMDLPASYCCLAYSTIRMPFLPARPTSVIRLTWKNTSLGKLRNSSAISAPRMAMGTMRNTATGSVQLSYSAARNRKTKISDSRKMPVACPPASFSCSDWPDHWYETPSGSCWAESASIAFSASPEEKPAAGTPMSWMDG